MNPLLRALRASVVKSVLGIVGVCLRSGEALAGRSPCANLPGFGFARPSARGLLGGMDLKALLLTEPKLSLAVAESISCGRLQARIGAISGASEFFLGGLTAYSIEQKVRHLGVDEPTARALNGVSCDVAEQMACGVCALFGARIGLATTGYAEPYEPRKVVHPFAWWALAHDLGDGRTAVQSGMVEMPGSDRVRAQEIAAMSALNALQRYLLELRGQQG